MVKFGFKGTGKVTTNNPLQYIIPIDEDKGLVMIAYFKWYNAEF